MTATVSHLVLTFALFGAEIQPAADAPQPHSPEESRRLFRVPPGFRVELVASEPHLADPVAIDFDAQGRIFVCEIHGYNLEGHLDVIELNKTGLLDKAIRRIAANAEAIRRAEENQYGTVKLLEDTDGDGVMDRSTVWADRLPPCYGVVAARDGVIVLCAPDIVYLADRDGDGKAEVRKTLFTGFGAGELWTRISNPRWGHDNWIYAVPGGGSGGTIRGPALAEEVRIGAVCFRFKPDGSALQPCSGTAYGFGQAIDDFGDRFLCTNQQHALYAVPLPHRYLARNPFHAAPNPTINICTYGQPAPIYPASRPHPWRLARSEQPQWVKFYGATEATANGYFTAACGQTIYQADTFPAAYHGNHFSVDSSQNIIHRCLLQRDGAGYLARRATDEKVEFLTSTEQWFRPTNLTTGPDGALYVVDMYREIIEDYSAIPRYLQQQYGLIKGSDRGRIWRVVAAHDGKANGGEGRALKPRKFNLQRASMAELVGELSHGNVRWRQTAQRLLVERADRSAQRPLEAIVREGKTPQARLHALYTLDGLDVLQPDVVGHALGDDHFAVRAGALRLAERWLAKSPSLLTKILAMVDDPDAKVRLQLALSLGESRDRRPALPGKVVRALGQIAARYADQRWMQAAVLSSVPEAAGGLLCTMIRQEADLGKSRSLIAPLASIVGARHDNEELGNVLAAIAETKSQGRVSLQIASLEGLIEGLNRGKPQVLRWPAGQLGLRRLLGNPSPDVQRRALQVAGLLRLQEVPEMKAAFAAARRVALDADRPLEERQAAVGLLASAPYSELAPAAEELLAARQPLDLQLAAVKALSSAEDPQVAPVLLAGFKGHTPKLQSAVIDAIFSRQNRLPKLLDAVEQGVVRPSGLDTIRRLQLLENPDPQIGRRAKLLLGSQATQRGREDVVARYRKALAGSRDAKRGKTVFEKQCLKCHRLDDQGYEVGPDLSAVHRRADETLVADVMDPGNQITVGYNNYTVITDDGRIFTGVLVAETATSVTLRREENAEDTILRKDIDEMEASAASMMPEDLEKEVSPQDLADLIAYLRQVLGPAAPPQITLFEDERSLVEMLLEGSGRASLETGEPFSGTACLAVTPLQRYSSRIPDWDYRIVENPGRGEFRYLRLAWKSRGGQGVMIELADDGRWPSAEDPRRRYYSGRNDTGWAAVQVSRQVPGEWVVVTRDLWKDFGPFTLTGIAPTAIGGVALFDRIELLKSLDAVEPHP